MLQSARECSAATDWPLSCPEGKGPLVQEYCMCTDESMIDRQTVREQEWLANLTFYMKLLDRHLMQSFPLLDMTSEVQRS